jgi:hypothetical protein
MKKQNRIVRGWVVVCVLGGFLFSASAGRADPTLGLCNAITAQVLGTGLQVANQGFDLDQCAEIGTALAAVLSPPCLELYLADELPLASIAPFPPSGRGWSPLGIKICTGLHECGFAPAPGVCEGIEF